MDLATIQRRLARPGATLDLVAGDVALDELLVAMQSARFTGSARFGDPSDADRLCFRGGVFVGMRARRSEDGVGFRRALRGMRLVTDEALAAVSDDGRQDPRQVRSALLELGLVDGLRLQRAVELHVRRRLFALYDLPAATRLRIREGMDRLADFWPAPVDLRPVIAFGTVSRADPRRRAALMKRVLGRTIRLAAPYDAGRNRHGLPPAVVCAVQALEAGRRLAPQDSLPGLSPEQTAGVLLLLDRMALLKLD